MKKPHGFFLVDKSTDWTSFDVCARVRKHLNMKKVGHTGTLDPFATGLLVVAVGKATKMIPYLEKAEKTYEATFVLGSQTPTLDPESDVEVCTYTREVPTEVEVREVVESFVGGYEQVPPVYSALKIKGKRAYALARKGEAVKMQPRPVVVKSMDVVDYAWPEVRVKLRVGAGFYVRALARDVGVKLGVGGGYCRELRRTGVGELEVGDAETIEGLSVPIDPKYIIDGLEHREIEPGRLRDWWDGRAFVYPGEDGVKYLVVCQGKTVGIGEMVHGKLQPRVVMG